MIQSNKLREVGSKKTSKLLDVKLEKQYKVLELIYNNKSYSNENHN